MRAVVRSFVPLRFYVYRRKVEHGPMPERAGLRFYADALERVRSARALHKELPSEFYRDEMAGARWCCVAEIGDRPASIAWCYQRHHSRPFLIMDDSQVEISGVRTIDEFQGRGLFAALLQFVLNTLADEGERGEVFAIICEDNPASAKVFERVGFRAIAKVRRPSLFGPRYLAAEGRFQSWFEAFTGGAGAKFRQARPFTTSRNEQHP